MTQCVRHHHSGRHHHILSAVELIQITHSAVSRYPQISIQTGWRVASPLEMESEIIEPQEKVLPAMTSMQAWADQGGAWINLEYDLDTDMQKSRIEVISLCIKTC